MYLINVDTLELEQFYDTKIPAYFILSHRWEDREPTFQEFMNASQDLKCSSPLYKKVLRFCDVIKLYATQYVGHGSRWKHLYGWVDTVCINKESSAELSEAINSMYTWYADAYTCFVYLKDVPGYSYGQSTRPMEIEGQLEKSDWFTRGWTLQELIAPETIEFLDSDWDFIGDKDALADTINDITGIHTDILRHEFEDEEKDTVAENTNVAQIMSWAVNRKTSRSEDMAYCLMGLFGVNMPLLYGEGGEKAFVRLQVEIIRKREDDSIFAWADQAGEKAYKWDVLAPCPQHFRRGGKITNSIHSVLNPRPPPQLTSRGLQIYVHPTELDGRYIYWRLDCVDSSSSPTKRVVIKLSFINASRALFGKVALQLVDLSETNQVTDGYDQAQEWQPIYVRQKVR